MHAAAYLVLLACRCVPRFDTPEFSAVYFHLFYAMSAMTWHEAPAQPANITLSCDDYC